MGCHRKKLVIGDILDVVGKGGMNVIQGPYGAFGEGALPSSIALGLSRFLPQNAQVHTKPYQNPPIDSGVKNATPANNGGYPGLPFLGARIRWISFDMGATHDLALPSSVIRAFPHQCVEPLPVIGGDGVPPTVQFLEDYLIPPEMDVLRTYLKRQSSWVRSRGLLLARPAGYSVKRPPDGAACRVEVTHPHR